MIFSWKEERKWRQQHEWVPESTGCLRNRSCGRVQEHLRSASLVAQEALSLFDDSCWWWQTVVELHVSACSVSTFLLFVLQKHPQVDSVVHPAAVWWNYFFDLGAHLQANRCLF